MRKLLLLALVLVALGAVVVMGVKTQTSPPCPINQPFGTHTNCSCPIGYHLRSECTKPGLEHWQCVILEKELLYCIGPQ